MSTDDAPDRIERPLQATPGFFVETLTEHERRNEIDGGMCALRMDDGGRRRFILDRDVNELVEDDYVIELGSDLIDLIEHDGLVDGSVEATVPVDDVDRVVEEATEEETVTLVIDDEALAGILAKFLAAQAANE